MSEFSTHKSTLGPRRQSAWLLDRVRELSQAILDRASDTEAPVEQLRSLPDWCAELSNQIDRLLSAYDFERKVDASKKGSEH